MMSFGTYRRARNRESVVPMINVVFLLLIFFLMTAQIAPPDPIEITPPVAELEVADLPPGVLYVAANGDLAYGAARGEAVFAALAARVEDNALPLRADADLPALALARLLEQLRAIGIHDVSLIAVAR